MKLSKALRVHDNYVYMQRTKTRVTPAESNAIFTFFQQCGIFYESPEAFGVVEFENSQTKDVKRILCIDPTAKMKLAEYKSTDGSSLVSRIDDDASIARQQIILIKDDIICGLVGTSVQRFCGVLADIGKTKIQAVVLPKFYAEPDEAMEGGTLVDLVKGAVIGQSD
jgi:hypothetical protein